MIYKVDQHELIIKLSQELKNHIEMPDWALFVKTGVHRETVPRNADWWYIRAASILRVCYKQGPIGVSKLRNKYGGKQNRGVRPDKFARASGKVIRTILQQLQTAELVKEHTVSNHKGRIATPAGASLLVKAAKSCTPAAKPVKAKAPAKAKKEEKAEVKEEAKVEKTEAKAETKTEKVKEEVKAKETPKADGEKK